MRVAMVGTFGLQPKGTMLVRALPLARALVRRGHEVTVHLPPWSFPQDAGREWNDNGVAIRNVKITPSTAIPFRLVRAARATNPDVIHFFKPKAFAGAAQWLAWQMRRAGLLHASVILDEDDWEGSGGWNDLEKYTYWQKRLFAWQERWGLRHADAVTVASRALETIAWSLGVPRERVAYLPNGVNHLPPPTQTREQVRSELGLGDAPTILLYTRFFEFSLARLNTVLAQVMSVRPEARLLLVGKGLAGEENRFLALAAAGGWRERIIDAGWVELERLTALFSAADVAIYPFDDTLVNRTKAIVKLMDLLAAGVPVVADRVGQIREYISHAETGILVEPGDTEGFARSVLELLHEPERRGRLGACAGAHMARDYDWNNLAAQVEGVYTAQAKSLSNSSRVGT